MLPVCPRVACRYVSQLVVGSVLRWQVAGGVAKPLTTFSLVHALTFVDDFTVRCVTTLRWCGWYHRCAVPLAPPPSHHTTSEASAALPLLTCCGTR